MASGVVRRWFSALFLAVAVHVPLPAVADDDAANLPARVGRVSEIDGEIFLATQDRANVWVPIGLNYPITSGDSLWVSADGRAEIDFGGGRFRMAGDTNLQVIALDDRQLALFVASGRVIIRVRSLGSDQFARVETPNTQIDIDRPGQYRVDVDGDQPQHDTYGARGRGWNSLCRRGSINAARAGGNGRGHRRCRARHSERLWQRRL